MKMIAGLGNPGREYVNTPHNAGFAAVDALGNKLGAKWRFEPKFKADMAVAGSGNEKFVLVKPATYMNASGEAVSAVMRYYGMEPADIVVICDDADLPPARIRIRPGGGYGGHKGLLSIGERLGADSFVRVRIGVGRGSHPEENLIDFVLGKIEPSLSAAMEEAYLRAADAAVCAAERGAEFAMNKFNAFCVEPPAELPAKEK